MHEAGVAVLQTRPDLFWKFSKALFDKQTEYFDANVVHEPRNKTYERLSKLAGGVGLDESKIYSLLEISDKPDKDGGLNGGNKVTNDFKLLVKANRLQGIHVTPTVLFNVGGRLVSIVDVLTSFAGHCRKRYRQQLQQRRLGAVVGEEHCVSISPQASLLLRLT